MAHKKAGGSSRNGRDSNSQRLGLKIFGGEAVLAGTSSPASAAPSGIRGQNVGLGKDHTLFALTAGRVEFRTSQRPRLRIGATDDGGGGRIDGETFSSAGIQSNRRTQTVPIEGDGMPAPLGA